MSEFTSISESEFETSKEALKKEFPVHPGYNLLIPPPRFSSERLRSLIPGRELSAFRQFLNPEGLNTQQQSELIAVINSLYAQTQINPDPRIREAVGSMWKPTYCQRDVLALPLLRETTIHPVSIVDDPERHRWIELDIADDITTIIDPSGLLPTQELATQYEQLSRDAFPDREKKKALIKFYQPYFGRKDKVKNEFPKKVYESGRRLSEAEISEEINILNNRLK